MPPEREVVVAVIACPRCGTDMEGTWLESEDPGCYPDAALQSCGHCGHSWEAGPPGYGFRFEAG